MDRKAETSSNPRSKYLCADMFLVLVGIFRINSHFFQKYEHFFQSNLHFQMNSGHVTEALSHDPGCAWPDLGGFWDTLLA